MRALHLVAIAAAGCGRIGFGGVGAGADGGDGNDAARDGIVADAPNDPALLGYYPLDDDPSDGIENRAVGGMNASCTTTCPVQIPSLFGGGYAFDGSTNVIVLADRPELAMQRGTIAMWIRATTIPAQGDYDALAGRAYGGGITNTWELVIERPAMLRLKGGGDASGASYNSTPYSSMGWVHVAMTWDDSIFQLYVGGSPMGQTTVFVRLYDAHPTVIGADQNSGSYGQWYGGEMDEVYVFSRALSDTEIAVLATLP